MPEPLNAGARDEIGAGDEVVILDGVASGVSNLGT